ncbi:hypothetical protein KFE19_05830 [Dysosmobacter sp. Marseille-Q4140]|nr:hypothetical protein KFE19_05830 [Dysosmobacter sp. Marseille-Q4140]
MSSDFTDIYDSIVFSLFQGDFSKSDAGRAAEFPKNKKSRKKMEQMFASRRRMCYNQDATMTDPAGTGGRHGGAIQNAAADL